MSKRFHDTSKWDKPWYRKLPPKYKCFWDYITSKCDLVGVWDKDFESASYFIGEQINEEDCLIFFKEQVSELSQKKWLIIDFVSFQYGEISENPKSPIHKKVLDTLSRYGIIYPINRVLNTLQVKEEEEVKEKVKEEVKEKPKKTELIFPYTTPEFLNAWEILTQTKKWKKKESPALQASLKKLSRVCVEDAIKMIENCIAGDWMGLVELKENEKYGNTKITDTGGKTSGNYNGNKAETLKLASLADNFLANVGNNHNGNSG